MEISTNKYVIGDLLLSGIVSSAKETHKYVICVAVLMLVLLWHDFWCAVWYG